MDFAEADRLFRHLREQHQRGMLSDDIFEAEVSQIKVGDENGCQWMIGIRSGNWYYLDDCSEWKAGDPHVREGDDVRCLQCGRSLELGEGICEECIAKAVAQTQSNEEHRGLEDERDRAFRYRDGVTYLAITVLGLVMVCAFLFSLQATASQWVSPASVAGPTALPVVLTEVADLPIAGWPTLTLEAPLLPITVSSLASPATIMQRTVTPALVPEPASPTTLPLPSPAVIAPPAVPPSGSLFYSLFDEALGTFNVYTSRIGGESKPRLLVKDASQPHVNVRGQLAYRSWHSSSRGITMSTLEGENSRRLVSYSEAARPSWSADGNLLLFYSLQESDRKSRIYRATSAGDFEVVKCDDTTIFGEVPAWLPDGRFATTSCEEGRCGIYVMGLDGARPFQLTVDTSDTAPEASPDGRHIAFMSHRDGNWDVYIVDVDGQNLVRLTSNQDNDGLPTWSPDGRYVAFVSDRDKEWAIWVSKPDGSEQLRLLQLNGSIDGRVRSAQSYESRGWLDERICWIP